MNHPKDLSDIWHRSEADVAILEAMPHIGREIIFLDEDGDRYQFLIRMALLTQMVNTLGWVVYHRLIKHESLSSEEIARTKDLAAALRAVSKPVHKKPKPGLEWAAEFDILGPKVAGQVSRCLQLWVDSLVAERARAYRLEREEQGRREREERLRRRRQRRAQVHQQAQAIEEPKPKPKPEHEEVVRCEKCHKRPVVKDNLCDPCLTWERNKLGRA